MKPKMAGGATGAVLGAVVGGPVGAVVGGVLGTVVGAVTQNGGRAKLPTRARSSSNSRRKVAHAVKAKTKTKAKASKRRTSSKSSSSSKSAGSRTHQNRLALKGPARNGTMTKPRGKSTGKVKRRTIGYGGGTTHPAPESALPRIKTKRR